MNIFHLDKLHVIPCEFNFRPDHCMYMQVCKAATGIRILHGNRGYFHVDKQPVFSAVYSAVEYYRLGTGMMRNFVKPLDEALADETVQKTNCGKAVDNVLAISKRLYADEDYSYYQEKI